MRVLVSGATGYIGKNLCDALYQTGSDFAVLIRNSAQTPYFSSLGVQSYVINSESSEKDLAAACNDFRPYSIVHAAGVWSNGRSPEELSKLVAMNISYSTHLALAALSVNAKFYNLATYWQLNQPKVSTVKNFYTQTKQTFESLLDSLIEHEGLSATSLYLYDNFGPRDYRGKIVDLLIAKRGDQFPLRMTDPNKYLNLLYIPDVVDGIVMSLKMHTEDRNLEIANSEVITLRKLVQLVEESTNEEICVEWEKDFVAVDDYSTHNYHYKPPSNWFPKYSLKAGLNKLLETESR
jgi:nucleoside-diphosphate-sugar epimerase